MLKNACFYTFRTCKNTKIINSNAQKHRFITSFKPEQKMQFFIISLITFFSLFHSNENMSTET